MGQFTDAVDWVGAHSVAGFGLPDVTAEDFIEQGPGPPRLVGCHPLRRLGAGDQHPVARRDRLAGGKLALQAQRHALEQLAQAFGGQTIVGAEIAEGAARVHTDFHLHDGCTRFVVLDRDLAWLGFILGKGAKADLQNAEGNTPLALPGLMARNWLG